MCTLYMHGSFYKWKWSTQLWSNLRSSKGSHNTHTHTHTQILRLQHNFFLGLLCPTAFKQLKSCFTTAKITFTCILHPQCIFYYYYCHLHIIIHDFHKSSLQLVLPPWPMYRRNSLEWQKPRLEKSIEKTDSKNKKKQKSNWLVEWCEISGTCSALQILQIY